MVPAKIKVAIDLFASLALIIAAYLAWNGVHDHVALAGCDGQSSHCNNVTESTWAMWGPFPVSLLGVGGYLSLMLALIVIEADRIQRHRTLLWGFMVIISLTGLGFIIWLTGLQWLAIGHFCVYCLSSHATGMIAFILVLIYSPAWRDMKHSIVKLGGTGALLLSGLIASHVLAAPEVETVETFTPPASSTLQIGKKQTSRNVTFLSGNLTFDVYQVPLVGDPQAEQVVVELFDYNCPSCRKVSHKMEDYKAERKRPLAVVLLPVPMESDCNPGIKNTQPLFRGSCEYSRLAMAVCHANRGAFPAYHHWLMEGHEPPSLDVARAKAEELVGKEALARHLDAEGARQWMQDGLAVFEYIQAKTLPRLIIGDQIISSSGSSNLKLYRQLDAALGQE